MEEKKLGRRERKKIASRKAILAAAKHEKELIEGNYSGHHINIENETPCRA